MQFSLDGYEPGDPRIARPHPSLSERGQEPPETADVLIVGSGPAGLVLAAQLARFPGIRTVLVDVHEGHGPGLGHEEDRPTSTRVEVEAGRRDCCPLDRRQ